ncbi:MAG TPA: hypothetical protein VNO22_01010 [Planctomycetota bacterium]|nr:hypothetical protein [Planctomycetota bacterium]
MNRVFHGLAALALALFAIVTWLRKERVDPAPAGRPTTPRVSTRETADHALAPSPTRPENPLPGHPGRLSSLNDIHALLTRLSDRFSRTKIKTDFGFNDERNFLFEEEARTGRRESRLLAAVYPEEVLRFALNTVRDTSLERHRRRYGIVLLGYLARQGCKEAEEELVRIASLPNKEEGEQALALLAAADPQGVHRTLYWKKCQDRWLSALDAVTSWPDPFSLATLKGVQAELQTIEAAPSDLVFSVKHRIKLLEILLSPNAEAAVLAILRNPNHPDVRDELWALRVAEIRRFEGLKDALRERLDYWQMQLQKSENAMEIFRRKWLEGDAPQDPFPVAPLVQRFVSGSLSEISDFTFDAILVLQLEIGGPLTDLEKARLRHFGYACDPRERLAELLAEEPTSAPK